MDIESYYRDKIDQVYQLNPTKAIDDLLSGMPIDSTYIIKLYIDINREWEKYRKYNIHFGVIIDFNRKAQVKNSIYDFDFCGVISEIITMNNSCRIILILDLDYNIVEIVSKSKLSHQVIALDSLNTGSISFSLAKEEIKVYISGHELEFLKQYKNTYYDVIEKKLYGIEYYKLLLKDFFDSEIQYDPNKKLYAYKDNYHSTYRSKIDTNPNLLCSAPEEKFQEMLVKYLNNNCRDIVQKEIRTPDNDRYDIWVANQDNKIYVFELKWLGKSISPNGNINTNYDNSDRAISGAYQLKDYVDNAYKYDDLLSGDAIYCGVLVIYDARDEQPDIQYPKELDIEHYPNIDLTQHFRMKRKKIPASMKYEYTEKKKNA